MGDRSGRTTRRFDSSDLVALTKKPIVETEQAMVEDDPFAEWNEPVVATGSQNEALPTTSRTATLHDPLTTGLLAEVARRTSTLEIDPRTIELAIRNTQEIDPDLLAAALRDAERTPVPAEPVQPNTKRRK